MLPAKAEELRLQAYRLLDDYGAGKVSFVVPDIFWAECGNVLWKAARQKRLSPAEAKFALSSMLSRRIPTLSTTDLLSDAISIAFDYDRAVYDCLYVALASQARIDLITADERLANALAARFPVKWLGAM